jgi:hypothetical protein
MVYSSIEQAASADVADREDAGLAVGLEDAVADFLDQ